MTEIPNLSDQKRLLSIKPIGPGSQSVNVVYWQEIKAIVALIEQSDYCEQEIQVCS